jgi:pilus assembly protein Flp/PilA
MLKFLIVLDSLLADRIERDDKGATAVEYGLMVALIAMAIIVAVGLLGFQLDRIFDLIVARLAAVV